MVGSRRLLEIIDRNGLIEHAAKVGDWLLSELVALGGRHTALASNIRGRGLMCAFDLPDTQTRDVAQRLLRDDHVLVLPCGERSIRVRQALDVTEPELEFGLAALDRTLTTLAR